MEGSVLGGGMVPRHITVDADCAAVYETADPGCGTRLHEETGSVHVHRAVLAVGHARTAEDGGEVIDQVDACDRLRDHGLLADVAVNDFRSRTAQLVCSAGVNQSSDAIPAVEK